MFCTNCGTRNDDSATNCIQCGAELRRPTFGSADVNTPPPPPPPPQAQAPYQGVAIGQVTQQYGSTPQVPNYVVQAFLVTILCCNVFGAISLYHGAQVNPLLAAGNVAGAMEASRKARMWAWIGFGLIAGLIILNVVIVLLAGLGSLIPRH